MNQKRTGLVAMALILTLALGYLWGLKSDKSSDTTLTVRSYNVPTDKAQDLKNAINGIFGKTDEGWAQLANSNILIIKASRQMQSGIADFVNNYVSQKGTRSFIQLEYWMITGETGPTNAESFTELNPVLDSINKTKGPRKFKVVEEITSTMLNNEESQIEGRISEIKSRSSYSENRIYSAFEARSHFGHLRTNVVFTPGEFLVIGQNSGGEKPKSLAEADGGSEIYHVVRAKVVETL